jgi:hypothetical protein
MKKVIILIILLLTLIAPALASEESIHYLDSLTLKQTSSNYVNITTTETNYQVDYFQVWMYLFAQNDKMQTVISQTSVPSLVHKDNALLFSWEGLTKKKIYFDLSQTLQINVNPVKIKNKVPFPLKNISLDIVKYTQHTEHIDSSPEITSLAIQLSQNEDDLFVLEHKIADWVNKNIKYNLSTITSEANIPASIVLDQKYGVCDEITNLFISINRALGIPARFVSGIAYSESILFSEVWGNHGWAEVYFPNYGWVPYDVTYEQFAIIDPTHISLQKSIDGNEPSIEYKTSGFNYEFSQGNLEMNTKIINKGNKKSKNMDIDILFLADEISFGSYNVVTAKITNLKDYYVSEKVTLIPTSNS